MADLNNDNVFPAPHLLTHPAKHHLVSKTIHSVFNIEVNVRHQEEDNKSAFRHFCRILKRLPINKNLDIAEIEETTIPTEVCTGFVIEQRGNILYLLTTAHALDDYYDAKNHDLTPKDLNKSFIFKVLCIHQERHLLSLQGVDDKSEHLNRYFCDAKVVAVNTQVDLMLLKLNREDIYYSYQDADNFIICPEDHPLIKLGKSPPVESENVFLQGWPALRSQTSVWGHISHTNRRYDTLTSLNVKGYKMNLIEVPEFQCAAGTSGSAILNGAARCVAVYHGIQKNCKAGYAISYQDVKTFVDTALANVSSILFPFNSSPFLFSIA